MSLTDSANPEDAGNVSDERVRRPSYDAPYWHDRLKEYRTIIDEKWAKQRENLDRLYSKEGRADIADREYSIFWANLQVLGPATYSRSPTPVVAPRFKGGNRQASQASEVLERCLVTTYEQSDLHGCLVEARDELLRYGRGTARVRLAQDEQGLPRVEFDHFCADDFAHDPARSWRECRWVGFRGWLIREDFAERFADSMASRGLDYREVPTRKRNENTDTPNPTEEKIPVWEIWCKTTGQVHFVNEEFQHELDRQPPWLDLSGFWPCPKPAFGTLVPKKLRPVPDIVQYKDQLEEINEYTARIGALSQSLRLKGFYPAGTGEISEAIEAAMKSTEDRALLVPVSSFAALGGQSFKDSVIWLPIDQVVEVLRALVELRRVVIEDVYQITGISDIVRGQGEASETATAQQIKAQWGSIRMRDRQSEMARFARDMTRLGGEIIAENFPPQQIMEMAQVEPDAQAQAMPVLAFLRNDRARGFTIEIETDSTIQPDEDADKTRRIEFVTAVGQLFQQAAPIVMQAPFLGPFVGEVLKFTAQGFRAGRPLEGVIDQLVLQLGQMAQQAMQAQQQPQQPDPTEIVKRETEQVKGQAAQVGAMADIITAQTDFQKSQFDHAAAMEKMAVAPPEGLTNGKR